MFCYQCEQTFEGKGCSVSGVCGKDPKTAALQDLLVYAVKGVAQYAHRAAAFRIRDTQVDNFIVQALFSTVTNVDFDPKRIAELILQAVLMRKKIETLYKEGAPIAEKLSGAASLEVEDSFDAMLEMAKDVSITKREEKWGKEFTALAELITYGLKGACSYLHHALVFGRRDIHVFALLCEALDFLSSEQFSQPSLLSWVFKTGDLNYRAMELLDRSHVESYGHQKPTQVRITPVKGKAILISGHDMKDLEDLLKQTEGKGVHVYTHGEMLPGHAYPTLKKYPHLVGNYGGAWQNQHKEFSAFPGSILMTTNCLQRPHESYQDRIFTTGLVGWPNVRYLGDKNFSPLIESALKQKGFDKEEKPEFITIGYARGAFISSLDRIASLIQSKKIRHFFLIGGCDGAKMGRSYYTDFAKLVPKDCMILTLACGKYRFNKLEFGKIEEFPRLLDVGQCNDAYSLIQMASALAAKLKCSVNDLPLSFIFSWYEQKAVAILLTLLSLGIRNIHLGPSLPAFITPDMLKLLHEKFQIRPITAAEEDIRKILKR
jgi:hydroxylamine reductase